MEGSFKTNVDSSKLKDKSKKLKLQKLFFCGIGRLVVNVSTHAQ